MSGKRLFIAVDISDETRQAVAKYIDELRVKFRDVRVGWERPEKLHLTLKFLGDVEEANIEAVGRVVSEVAKRQEPFTATMSGCGIFPNPGEPRILWIGVEDGTREMARIAGDIDNAVAPLGFPREKRSYNPHLTIGRVREPRKGCDLAAEHIAHGFEPVEFSVPHLTLYESVLSPQGSAYAVVAKAALYCRSL